MKIKFTLFAMFLFLGTMLYGQFALIDLTDSEDPEILETTLSELTEDSHIVLKAGSNHEITSNALSFSLILEGEDGEPAVIKIAGSFNIASNETEIALMYFKNLELYGNNPTGDYVMNVDKAGKIDEIIFEDCHIHSFRGVARLRPVEVGLFKADNCIVSDVGGYGFVNVDDDNGSLLNTEITNSTFAIVERVFVSKTPTNSVKIHDCTFYHTPRHGRSFIDMADASSVIEGGVELINCILAGGLNGDPNNGVRAGEATPVTITNSYTTADFDWNSLGWRTDEEAPFIIYTGTSDDLFADAENLDFTIIDNQFAGGHSAGDPRFYNPNPIEDVPNSIKPSDASVEVVVANGRILFGESVSLVELYSITGQVVKSAVNVTSVDVQSLNGGVYIVRITNNEGETKVEKVLVR